MHFLVFEDNLMWSSRLVKTLTSLGHEVRVVTTTPDEIGNARVAIVNLGSAAFRGLVPGLKAKGIHVIGHAGHKEKDLLELGREAGCQTLATNSELTFKIPAILQALDLNDPD
jgi:hypothetical protein